MTKRKPDLQKIVSLKRQKAEQDFRAAQQARDMASLATQRLVQALENMDTIDGDVDALVMSHRSGHVFKLIRDIDSTQAVVSQKDTDLEQTRDRLKRAFDSEDRLKRMKD